MPTDTGDPTGDALDLALHDLLTYGFRAAHLRSLGWRSDRRSARATAIRTAQQPATHVGRSALRALLSAHRVGLAPLPGERHCAPRPNSKTPGGKPAARASAVTRSSRRLLTAFTVAPSSGDCLSLCQPARRPPASPSSAPPLQLPGSCDSKANLRPKGSAGECSGPNRTPRLSPQPRSSGPSYRRKRFWDSACAGFSSTV